MRDHRCRISRPHRPLIRATCHLDMIGITMNEKSNWVGLVLILTIIGLVALALRWLA